jgi:hypothetical protein
MNPSLNLLREYPRHAFIFHLCSGEIFKGKVESIRFSLSVSRIISIRIEFPKSPNSWNKAAKDFGFVTGKLIFLKHIKAITLSNFQSPQFISIHENL